MTTRITLKDGTEWNGAELVDGGVHLENHFDSITLSIQEYCDQWKSGVINALPESREEYEED
jgi:hypothetical protein